MKPELFQPSAPTSVAEAGLDPGLLSGLVLKTLYFAGNLGGNDLSDRLALPLPVTAEILTILRRERLCEVTGGSGLSTAGLQYSLTEMGTDRAVSALALNGYVGPAPIPLEAYFESVRVQSVQNVEFTRDAIQRSLSALVLDPQTIELIGQAVSSRRAILLYGGSGNGKSTAAESLRDALPGDILVPHAIEVMHQVIQVFDPSTHDRVEGDEATPAGRLADKRWVKVRRPLVFAAGELAASHLELVLDQVNKTYEAPIQMKANGGLLVIDDFGRQQLDASYLLNRWIVPLEKGIDNLSLHNGARFQVPFDVIPLFVTNKQPADLADDAFLRRLRYKIEVKGPSRDLFVEILKRECEKNGVAYDEGGAEYLVGQYFDKTGREMRGCHPRDIVEAIASAARYGDSADALSKDTIDLACANYFV